MNQYMKLNWWFARGFSGKVFNDKINYDQTYICVCVYVYIFAWKRDDICIYHFFVTLIVNTLYYVTS